MPKRLNEKNINTVEFYNKYFASAAFREDPIRHDYMMKPLRDGASIVEVGCGVSLLLAKIAATFPNADVHGLDFSPVAIERLQQISSDVELVVGDMFKTPWTDNLFDFVMSGETIEHVEDLNGFIDEMVRICKPDGTLILSTPYKETEMRGFATPEHIWQFDVPDIKDLFCPRGQTTIQVIKGRWDYLIIYCKIKK